MVQASVVNPVLKEKLDQYRARVENGIDQLLPAADTRPAKLHAAMRYSMEAGGKRIRPALLFAASELFEAQADPLAAAVAIECLHTYTLIHDDLPSIDDSELRRGRPSCHAQFDEATAVLAGDALLTYTFQLLARAYSEHPALATRLIGELADASGSERLIGGQQEDIENEGKPLDADTLRYIHENKTAALLTAALKMGLFFCAPAPEQIQLVEEAGYHLGLAFQIVDDILDATSDAETMGKPVGNDAAADKSTYVALHGIEGAHAEAKRHTEAAIQALEKLGGENKLLIDLVRELETRIH
ncbi:MAG TPA: polyprenyl synthetase [Opitutae bacterium]|nr:polyprenyl synthetase [Puniceicoccaceae bacterium]HBR95641.1 polyprenyl synthetase [Opitutae bacterium]|tara:strand:+ start:14022 stop:14924 length:903 start_codon:yes stop_codon:yes gene_type:complete